jgi:hypothetical protein
MMDGVPPTPAGPRDFPVTRPTGAGEADLNAACGGGKGREPENVGSQPSSSRPGPPLRVTVVSVVGGRRRRERVVEILLAAAAARHSGPGADDGEETTKAATIDASETAKTRGTSRSSDASSR